ncbi:MAG TPA: hypothetical protein VEB21_14285 [Terriglobales bacterium]|nr:hypothetical protein [Terriglobales bacterium]
MSDELISQALDNDIAVVHERFVAAMQQRLPGMNVESKERYFALLNTLVSKLEDEQRPMRQILQEMMSEAMTIIMQELNAGD